MKDREIYNERMERMEAPDLTKGFISPSVRVVHHEAVEGTPPQWHYETIAEYANGGRDVERVIDVPGIQAQEAWDEEIPIGIYYPYPEQAKGTEKTRAAADMEGLDARLRALESAIAVLTQQLRTGMKEKEGT